MNRGKMELTVREDRHRSVKCWVWALRHVSRHVSLPNWHFSSKAAVPHLYSERLDSFRNIWKKPKLSVSAPTQGPAGGKHILTSGSQDLIAFLILMVTAGASLIVLFALNNDIFAGRRQELESWVWVGWRWRYRFHVTELNLLLKPFELELWREEIHPSVLDSISNFGLLSSSDTGWAPYIYFWDVHAGCPAGPCLTSCLCNISNWNQNMLGPCRMAWALALRAKHFSAALIGVQISRSVWRESESKNFSKHFQASWCNCFTARTHPAQF